jgi:glycosyltransferase involved in cell wall biosynthesis
MNEPFFSIIVPVYNVEKYLSQCVESILRQTYETFEVILVDDGAKDCSGAICDEFATKDKRIKVIHKQNGGLSSARNAGIQQAQGEYILFVDSDDYWSNNTMLKQLFCYLDGRERLTVWKYCRCEEESDFYNDGEKAPIKEYVLSQDYKVLFGKGILFASAWCAAIPRTWFLKYDLSFEEGIISEDVEWYSRLLECAKNIAFFKSNFYVYRNRQGSISNTPTLKMVSDIEGHIEKMLSKQRLSPQQWRASYIGEQTSNFAILLSRSSHPNMKLEQYMRFFPFLRNAVRNRSRVIYIIYRLFGAKKMLSLLRKVRKL